MDWTEATRPTLTADLVIGGRERIVDQVCRWLTGEPRALGLQADVPEEAIAFLAASLERLPPPLRDAHLARALLIRDPTAWWQVLVADQPLLLVPVSEDIDASQAVRRGHHVFVPLGKESSPSLDAIELPRLRWEAAKNALKAMGIPENRVDDLAGLARRSLFSLRRKLALSPGLKQPSWAQPAEGHNVIPAMLAGSWDDRKDGDREIVAFLANKPYEDIIRVITRWAHESDPPVRRIGNAWLLVSKEDAWSQLARLITPVDLGRFEEVILKVLSAPDPSLELPSNRRWAAEIFGKGRFYSDLLRKGLSDSLALMGARSETPFSDGSSPQDHVKRIIDQLLRKANNDQNGDLWASLSDLLPLLSEAAPEIFLGAVDEGLSGDQPILINLFTDTNHQNSPFPRSPHTGLLWALENLAWHPDHLGHAALFLAKLDRLDPGGVLSNRPFRSLSQIFLLLRPQTAATAESRLHVLDLLRKREPAVAWRLLVDLLPQYHIFSTSIHTPRWRDWQPDEEPQVTYGELDQFVREILNRLLIDVGTDGSRWGDLIKRLSSLPVELQDEVIDRLSNYR